MKYMLLCKLTKEPVDEKSIKVVTKVTFLSF